MRKMFKRWTIFTLIVVQNILWTYLICYKDKIYWKRQWKTIINCVLITIVYIYSIYHRKCRLLGGNFPIFHSITYSHTITFTLQTPVNSVRLEMPTLSPKYHPLFIYTIYLTFISPHYQKVTIQSKKSNNFTKSDISISTVLYNHMSKVFIEKYRIISKQVWKKWICHNKIFLEFIQQKPCKNICSPGICSVKYISDTTEITSNFTHQKKKKKNNITITVLGCFELLSTILHGPPHGVQFVILRVIQTVLQPDLVFPLRLHPQ